ncbi:methyltransferase domain-containing protein [Methanosarcina sp. Z-7115]|uniref:Methyltransferase domain-containing protein n=1 Tax=Methanosarcina baikalica TaxID=3073890 RepID=A0ABU2D5A1_9EURY|nr:methyltransferase domain-containing protein [Methanosarcina sp. Z-7115]MDR7667153.1 methyltransferase domain-containing protein [Methanosarcina sp. Z-7115]
MELQKKDNIDNLVECWKKATVEALNIPDEGRMAEFWNKRSKNYSKNMEKEQRKKRTDEILEFLEEAGFNPEGSKVLDIGCGPGTLSLPLARLGTEVTALDISSGMLDRLKDTVKKESLPVDIIECSWWTADIDELGFRNEYDLVIASMTPAIRDIENFDKMTACSKNLCYYSNFLRRGEDRAYRDIRSSILGENSVNNMNGINYPFMYLYLSGYKPSVRINHSEWEEETNWKEAADQAIDFIGRGRDFDDETKEKIRDYYQNASPDGMYHSESDVYTGMMTWEVNGR